MHSAQMFKWLSSRYSSKLITKLNDTQGKHWCLAKDETERRDKHWCLVNLMILEEFDTYIKFYV